MILLIFSILLSSAEQRVVVGSYNVQNLQNAEKLSIDFLELQRQVDVIGLQEVMTTGEPPSLEIISGYPYHCVQKVNLHESGKWESQVILSRYPLTQCGFHFLDASGEKKRGVQWAHVQVSATQKFLFLNTDHESHAWLLLGASDRLKQLQSLKKILQECVLVLSFDCQVLPSVLVGDFNTSGVSLWEWKSSREEIKKTSDFLLPWKHSDACNNIEQTFVSFFGDYELDHIYVHGASAACRKTLMSAQGSDHRPIYTEIIF